MSARFLKEAITTAISKEKFMSLLTARRRIAQTTPIIAKDLLFTVPMKIRAKFTFASNQNFCRRWIRKNILTQNSIGVLRKTKIIGGTWLYENN